jgi:hypothetical protein
VQNVKIAAVDYCYYIIIINVLGYIQEDFENMTGWLTDEEATPVFLKQTGKNARNGRKNRVCYSGIVTHMKLLYKKKRMWI